MGDRANIVIENDAGRIYLYTHWAGYSLPETLRSALERGKSRWDDESYLTRIIFCEMVKGSEADLTGYGISNQLGDNGHPFLVVNVEEQTVAVEGDETTPHTMADPAVGQSYSFTEYVALAGVDWGTLAPTETA